MKYNENDQPLISVIMPVYQPGIEIKYAVKSLLDQSWQNLEIIIVDDASGESFKHTFNKIMAMDSRINVIYQSHNTEACGARNLGLKNCTGQYITVHDSDDWSHPQKLELQASHLSHNPKVRVNTTALARCTESLKFVLPKNPNAEMIRVNYSSAMYRKADLLETGGWNNVRVSAVSELIRRFSVLYGKNCVSHIYPKVPMSFALSTNSSLTGNHRTNLVFHT